MKDGSDAVSDWPLLNALLNTAGGATWVSLHHGGGVGMGYSQHAGVVIVCDGTDEAARRIERVLWNDPATGVMRHADAGYDDAVACAREQGLNLPMLTAERADAASPRTTHARRTAGHPRAAAGQPLVMDPQALPGDPGQRRRGAARGRRRRAGLRRQHRLRQAGQHAHQRGRPGDAAAQPDPLAQRRRGRAAAPRRWCG